MNAATIGNQSKDNLSNKKINNQQRKEYVTDARRKIEKIYRKNLPKNVTFCKKSVALGMQFANFTKGKCRSRSNVFHTLTICCYLE